MSDIGDPSVGCLAGVVANSPITRVVIAALLEGRIGDEVFDFGFG